MQVVHINMEFADSKREKSRRKEEKKQDKPVQTQFSGS